MKQKFNNKPGRPGNGRPGLFDRIRPDFSDNRPVSALTLNLFYRLPVAGVCLIIFWQSSLPSMVTQPLFAHMDKVLHITAYAVLALLAGRALKKERPCFKPLHLKVLAILFAVLYGLSDEIHQVFVPSRTASFWDFAADILGSVLGGWLYFNVLRKK